MISAEPWNLQNRQSTAIVTLVSNAAITINVAHSFTAPRQLVSCLVNIARPDLAGRFAGESVNEQREEENLGDGRITEANTASKGRFPTVLKR